MNDDLRLEGAVDDYERFVAVIDTVKALMEDLGLSTRKTQAEFKSLSQVGDQFSASMGAGVEQLTRGMSSAFERFVQTGKFSFSDLKNTAVDALDSIYQQAVNAGLNSLFGGSSGGGGLLQTIFSSALGSFAPRALGGPVSAGQPFLVGEAGPEIFVPGQQGSVVRPHAASSGAPVNVTINMSGPSGSSSRSTRQSASQIASQVSRAVTRAQRNG